MATAQIANILLRALVLHASTGDYESGGKSEFPTLDERWPSGTGASQADAAAYDTRALAGSANEDINLRSIAWTPDGSTAVFAEVRALIIKAAATNGGELEIKPTGATGWTGLLKNTTDIIKLEPGATLALIAPPDGSYTTTAGSNSINISNTDGSAASYDIMVVGTSA